MLLMYYCLFILIPYFVDVKEEMTQRRHLVEMGYDYAVQPFFLEKLLKEIKRYASYLIPFINIFNILELFDGKYARFDKKDIKKMLTRGEIKPLPDAFRLETNKEILRIINSRKNNMAFPVAELTREALISQAYAISQINRSDDSNLVETWRDFSTDRKIELLLGELEALYCEKAMEMGINLDEEFEKIEESSEVNSEKDLKKLKY